MNNKDVLDMLKRTYSDNAPDVLNNLDFDKIEKEKTKVIPIRKKYYTAAIIYAAACLVVFCIIPFIIGGENDPDDPTPAVSATETDEYGDSTEYDLGGEEFVILSDSRSEYMLKNDSIYDEELMAEVQTEFGDLENSPEYYFSRKKAERLEAAEKRFGINISIEKVDDPAFETVVREQAGQTVNNAILHVVRFLPMRCLRGIYTTLMRLKPLI